MTLVAGAAHAHVSACFRVCKDVYPVFSLFCFCTPYTALQHCGHDLRAFGLHGFTWLLYHPGAPPEPCAWLSEATS